MEEVDRIAGADRLMAVFGYWPSFHDAEVLWMRLDRCANSDKCYGPTLETLIHTYEITNEVGPDGYYVLRNHVLVHLRFIDVVELRMEAFNHQNFLMGLTVTNIRNRQMERVLWAVRFDSSFGVDASFQCYGVEVVSVIRCSKDGVPMHA